MSCSIRYFLLLIKDVGRKFSRRGGNEKKTEKVEKRPKIEKKAEK